MANTSEEKQRTTNCQIQVEPRGPPRFQITSMTLGITGIIGGIMESLEESQESYLKIIIILKYKTHKLL